jgi:hypothetical protein
MEQFCRALHDCYIPEEFAQGSFVASPIFYLVGLDEVQNQCSEIVATLSEDNYVIGCSVIGDGVCKAYVPFEVLDLSEEMFQAILRHELAHCRGWKHD